jgi:hypothetical protein
MDLWESRAAYEEFREKWAAEYAAIDRKCEGLTSSEKLVDHVEVKRALITASDKPGSGRVPC